MTHSAHLHLTQVCQFQKHDRRWATGFHFWLNKQPTHPLNPVIPDNACTLRITAAAGTELAGAYSYTTVRPYIKQGVSWYIKAVYNPEGIHPARGMAGSGFRPLTNIPYCCLP